MPYQADGAIVRKLPAETKQADGTTLISVGFPVCRMSEYCGDQAETLAALLNDAEGVRDLRTALADAHRVLSAHNLGDEIDLGYIAELIDDSLASSAVDGEAA